LFLQQVGAVNETSENASSSSDAVVAVTAQASDAACSDVIPASSTTDGDIHIVVDKQMSTEAITEPDDGSIHVVVDNQTSSQVVHTMVTCSCFVKNELCVLCLQLCKQKLINY